MKVVELARILAGPWAGQTLADLGADVVKVERPGAGDDTRGWGPPFVEGEDGERLDAAYFHSCNRGKRSLAVDFEKPEGQEIVRRLAAEADVLIENFKTGGLAKYGLDYASLTAVNPQLVYCSITGFGQTAPTPHRAGYDFIIQGMGGMMDLTGEPEGEPQKPGVAFADIFTGLYAVIAIQAALRAARDHRPRRRDRHGAVRRPARRARQSGDELSRLRTARRAGWATPIPISCPIRCSRPPTGRSSSPPATTGRRAISAASSAGPISPTIRAYATNADRMRNRAEYHRRAAEAATAKMRRADLLAALEAAHVPAGPINTVAEAFADPQVDRARDATSICRRPARAAAPRRPCARRS